MNNLPINLESEAQAVEKITQEVIDTLTPLEKEAAEWCYQRFMEYLEGQKDKEEKKENEKNCVTVTHLLSIEAFNFKEGEQDAFQALKDKRIIFKLTPMEEKGGDFHEIVVDDSIIAIHRLLENSK